MFSSAIGIKHLRGRGPSRESHRNQLSQTLKKKKELFVKDIEP